MARYSALRAKGLLYGDTDDSYMTGSFQEFLPLLQLFKTQFSPSNLPYHLIVPSLPGYAFSSSPSVDKNFTVEDIARVLDKLMKDLGFENGYIAQGGDIGSRIGRVLAVDHEGCKGQYCHFSRLSCHMLTLD